MIPQTWMFVVFFAMIVLYSYLHRLRGTGSEEVKWKKYIGGKWGCYALTGLCFAATAAILGVKLMLACYLFAGVFVGSVLLYQVAGWGKYFPADNDTYAEKEVGFIDWLSDKLFGEYNASRASDAKFEKRWKTGAMCLRYGIFAIPKYLILAYLLHNPWVVLGFVLLFPCGLLYRLAYESTDKPLQQTPRSEWLSGAWIGTVDAGILYLTFY